MKIINNHWMPILEDLRQMPDPSVKEVVLVYDEEANAAGFYDPEKDRICVNVAPNVLAAVAKSYDLSPRDMERIAIAVYLEECAHSRGETDEAAAASIAAKLVRKIPQKEIDIKCGIVTYINKSLHVMEENVTN